jgi:hypothetical protein
LLLRFEQATGCGVLVNTSFNVRGEPIVCTPDDAYRCLMNTEMDFLILGGFVVERTAQPKRIPRRGFYRPPTELKPTVRDAPEEWRKSALTTALGLVMMSSVLRWRHILANDLWLILLALAGVMAICAVWRPRWFRGYHRLSTRFGSAINQVIGRTVLLFFFGFILTPVGLALRLAGKDVLQLRPPRGAATFWQPAKDYGPLDRLF